MNNSNSGRNHSTSSAGTSLSPPTSLALSNVNVKPNAPPPSFQPSTHLPSQFSHTNPTNTTTSSSTGNSFQQQTARPPQAQQQYFFYPSLPPQQQSPSISSSSSQMQYQVPNIAKSGNAYFNNNNNNNNPDYSSNTDYSPNTTTTPTSTTKKICVQLTAGGIQFVTHNQNNAPSILHQATNNNSMPTMTKQSSKVYRTELTIMPSSLNKNDSPNPNQFVQMPSSVANANHSISSGSNSNTASAASSGLKYILPKR